MTSIPANTTPRSLRTGPTREQIHRSLSVSSRPSPRAPITRLPRLSSAGGMRASAYGIASPSTSKMRLSPSLISGMKSCAMANRASSSVRVSNMTFALLSPSATTKIDFPPMPSSGFTTIFRCSFRNAFISDIERVISVSGAQSGNQAVYAFSFISRRLCGRLTISAPAISARSRM